MMGMGEMREDVGRDELEYVIKMYKTVEEPS